jgi:hypothetical protein
MGIIINQNNEKSAARNALGGKAKYAGLNGSALLYAVVCTGTICFALFGYGE